MKIGIVISGIPPGRVGGAEVQAWELARRLAREHSVTLFTRRYPGVESGMRDGVRIVCTPNLYGRMPNPVPYAIHLASTTRAICREAGNLDVLLCYMTEPGGLIGSMVKRRTGLPFCTWIRGGDWYFVQPHWWGRMILRRVFAGSARVLVQTPRIRDEVKGCYPALDPVVIPNGIELDARVAKGDSLFFLGNLLRRKGVHVLLEAVRGHPEIPVVIAGDGPEREGLETMAAGRENVRFIGRVEPDRARDLMVEQARVLVLPAVAGEGMPNVLLEAMSVGIPVIATDVAGVRDLVEHGVSGLVAPAGDAAALEEAVVQLWGDKALRERLGQAGRRTAAGYGWDKVVASHLEVLGAVARGGIHGN